MRTRKREAESERVSRPADRRVAGLLASVPRPTHRRRLICVLSVFVRQWRELRVGSELEGKARERSFSAADLGADW
ncbi:hypothetical protein L484_011735 [Morus notabilis]|uniref:Uncharacterized protein n=1 Tax=Morus notabilis TaxID=981085 RepID=W9SAY6_9ROSA|nr:hypothetical protein L484_011735 [Morus notabilis]